MPATMVASARGQRLDIPESAVAREQDALRLVEVHPGRADLAVAVREALAERDVQMATAMDELRAEIRELRDELRDNRRPWWPPWRA